MNLQTVLELYQQGWSTCKIADKLGARQGTVYYLLKKNGISLRGHSEAARIGIAKGLNRMEEGLVNGRMGGSRRTFRKTISPEGRRKLSEARRRKRHLWLGERNPAKRPDVRKKMSESRRAFMSRNPDFVIWLREHGRTLHKLSQASPKRTPTKPERVFAEICARLKLPLKYVGNGQVWIGGLNPDFVDVRGKRVAVDILGDYWHSPLLNQGIRPNAILAERSKVLKRHGWKLVHFWASEILAGNAESVVTQRFSKEVVW